MGLVELGPYRVGFWMADRMSTPEVPPAPQVREEGTRVLGGATLVLAAADGQGVPVWSLLLHEPMGASLMLPWRGHLVIGLGAALCLVDTEGRVVARYRTGDEWVTASAVGDRLLLAGRRSLHLLDELATRVWEWPFEGDAVHLLGTDETSVRLALMSGEDWRDVRLDLRTGQEIASTV